MTMPFKLPLRISGDSEGLCSVCDANNNRIAMHIEPDAATLFARAVNREAAGEKLAEAVRKLDDDSSLRCDNTWAIVELRDALTAWDATDHQSDTLKE